MKVDTQHASITADPGLPTVDDKPTGESQSQAAVFELLELPHECIFLVLDHSATLSDLFHLRQTCILLNGLAPPAYRNFVGPQPWPLQLKNKDGKNDYYSIAKKQVELRSEIALNCKIQTQSLDGAQYWSSEAVLGSFGEVLYAYDDAKLTDFAAKCLFMLQYSPERDTPMWREVVATALMIQQRSEQAKIFYAQFTDATTELQRSIRLLTAARFGWPFEKNLSVDVCLSVVVSREVLMLTPVLAAYSGSLRVLKKLHRSGIAFNQGAGILINRSVRRVTPASAAARAGREDILRFLHECGVNLIAPQSWSIYNGEDCCCLSPLKSAVQAGASDVARYLLSLGALPNAVEVGIPRQSPATTALREGEFNIFRLFMDNTPSLKGNYGPEGNLWVAEVFCESLINTDRKDILRFLADVVRVNINAVGPTGEGAVHMAAKYGDVGLMSMLIDFRADVSLLNSTGQSAFELAVSFRHVQVAHCLAGENFEKRESIKNLLTDKIALAKAILSSERAEHVLVVAIKNAMLPVPGVMRLEEARAAIAKFWKVWKMDERFAKIWAKYYSIAALTDYKKNFVGIPIETNNTIKRASHKLSELRCSFYLNNFSYYLDTPPSVAPTGKDRAKSAMARKIITTVYPSENESAYLPSLADYIVSEMSSNDLQALVAYFFESPAGRWMAAGHKAKLAEEAMEVGKFCSELFLFGVR